MVRPKSPETQKLRERAVQLLLSGRTQSEVAKILNRDIRTIQKWVALPEVKDLLESRTIERKALVQSDPVVLSLVEVRNQVNQILEYHQYQQSFSLQMGQIVEKALAVLLKALERLEESPDELNARLIPQLMKAVAGCSEAVSHSWERASGLEQLLGTLRDEPETTE